MYDRFFLGNSNFRSAKHFLVLFGVTWTDWHFLKESWHFLKELFWGVLWKCVLSVTTIINNTKFGTIWFWINIWNWKFQMFLLASLVALKEVSLEMCTTSMRNVLNLVLDKWIVLKIWNLRLGLLSVCCVTVWSWVWEYVQIKKYEN